MTRPLEQEPAHRLGTALASIRYAVACLRMRDFKEALVRLNRELEAQDRLDVETAARLEAEEQRLFTPGHPAPIAAKGAAHEQP